MNSAKSPVPIRGEQRLLTAAEFRELAAMPAEQRRAYVCRERLIGARTFTDQEMQDPILRGRDDLRDPCDRIGPLGLSYYWRTAVDFAATIRSAFAH